MQVNRSKFLDQLRLLDAGLSPKETVDQSSHYVFKDGEVMTFNGEIACRHKSMLNGVEGAVSAQQLKLMLDKMTEEFITIEVGKNIFKIEGKKKDVEFNLDSEILLPIDQVEPPEKWRKLPDGFGEAVNMVYQCASTEEQFFNLTCVHIGPHWLEATDNIHATRYMIDTGFKENALVRHTSIKHIVDLGMTKVSETETYVHFKAPSGLILSLRKFADEFPDLESFMQVKGSPIVLPKSLAEGTGRAEILSSEDKEANRVRVRLKGGKLILKAEGVSGKYREWTNKIKYKGDPVDFFISPTLLNQIIDKHDKAEITSNRLAVKGENYMYVSYLAPVRKESSDGED